MRIGDAQPDSAGGPSQAQPNQSGSPQCASLEHVAELCQCRDAGRWGPIDIEKVVRRVVKTAEHITRAQLADDPSAAGRAELAEHVHPGARLARGRGGRSSPSASGAAGCSCPSAARRPPERSGGRARHRSASGAAGCSCPRAARRAHHPSAAGAGRGRSSPGTARSSTSACRAPPGAGAAAGCSCPSAAAAEHGQVLDAGAAARAQLGRARSTSAPERSWPSTARSSTPRSCPSHGGPSRSRKRTQGQLGRAPSGAHPSASERSSATSQIRSRNMLDRIARALGCQVPVDRGTGDAEHAGNLFNGVSALAVWSRVLTRP